MASSQSCETEANGSHEQHAPFLRVLPAELRNRIYEHLLADKVIHIFTYASSPSVPNIYRTSPVFLDHTLTFGNVICQAKETEEDVYERYRNCNAEQGCSCSPLVACTDGPKVEPYADRHRDCLDLVQSYKDLFRLSQSIANLARTRELPPERPHLHSQYAEMARSYQQERRRLIGDHKQRRTLDLAILRVCKEIHREARLLPYAMNTFAFSHGSDLDLFISKTLTPVQRKAIRNIQINAWLEQGGFGLPIQPSTPLLLENLTSLDIALTHPEKSSMAHLCVFYGLGVGSVRISVARDDDLEEENRALCTLYHHAKLVAQSAEAAIKGRDSALREAVRRLRDAEERKVKSGLVDLARRFRAATWAEMDRRWDGAMRRWRDGEKSVLMPEDLIPRFEKAYEKFVE